MSKLLQLRGGTTSEHSSFTGALREVTVDTDKDTLVIHDGSTAGGHALPRTAAEIVALISNDAIDSQHYAAGSIDTEHLSADSVTVDKLNLISTSSTPSLEARSDGTTDGYIQLNCTVNSHGIKLMSPPHSAGASYTLVFPPNDGDNGQFLTSNGSGVMTWTTADLTNLSGASLTSGIIPTARINAGSIANDLLDSQHYAAGSIDLEHLSSESVDEDNLYVSNAGSNGQYLQKQSGNAGGLTWGTVDLTTLSGANLTSGIIPTARINASSIANDLLDSQHYAAGSIDTEHLAADSVTTAKIADSVALGGSPTTTTQSAADNSTKVATTAYADAAIAALADSAPSTLNTLNELAAALGDDANYATTTATAIGTKMPLAGGAFTGAVTTNSTFDGRDVATDGTKLDGIEASATADQTAAQIKTHLENGIDSVHYVDGSIDRVHLAADIIDGTKIADDVINSEHYAAGSIDAEHIASGAVTAVKLAVDRRHASATTDVYTGNANDYTYYDADVGIRWYTANAEDMRLTDAGDLHVDGNITAYSTTISDERLKTDITTVGNALEKVCSIRGVEFTRTKDGKRSAGVIAQELEVVLPQAITESALPYEADTETLYKTVDYDAIHALLIEAIKELHLQHEGTMSIIQSQQEQIDALLGE